MHEGRQFTSAAVVVLLCICMTAAVRTLRESACSCGPVATSRHQSLLLPQLGVGRRMHTRKACGEAASHDARGQSAWGPAGGARGAIRRRAACV
jgi:hypothetical protein